MGNVTSDRIIGRLPRRDLLSPRDISAAAGMSTTRSILDAVQRGALDAVKIGNRYTISRTEAERWIRSSEVVSDER